MGGPVAPSPPPNRTPLTTPAVGRPAAPRPQGSPHYDSHRAPSQAPQQADSDDFESSRISHVRILPTSLPYVHDQLMEQREREREQRARDADRLREERAQASLDDDLSGARSPEEQEATARALKPHSRSIIDLNKLRLEPPEGRSAPQQPKRTRKWQFGIRSRNQPYEAMLYLYKAIAAQGGVWEI